jgi:hypothetical protein
MKSLRVIVNTHKRPAQALAVIECLRALASGEHRVSYVLAYDEEDRRSDLYFAVLQDQQLWADDVEWDVRPRPFSLQDCWNRNMVPPFEHDIYLPMPDDGFCGADNWDDRIVQVMSAAPRPDLAVIGWLDTACDNQLTVPIVARGWLEAMWPTPLMENATDAWFADTALSETWSFVFGFPPKRPRFLPLVTKPNNYNPLLAKYDADELWDGYAERRGARLYLADRIREQHGIPKPPHIGALLNGWAERDVRGREQLKIIQERMRNGGLDNQVDNSGQPGAVLNSPGTKPLFV